MEAITGLDTHLCLQSWPAGTHRTLRRTGIVQDTGIVIGSMSPSITSLGEARNGGCEKAYLSLQKTGAVQLRWRSAGLTGLTTSHIGPPHAPHTRGEHPQTFASHQVVTNVNISDTFHSCLNLNSLKSVLPVLRSFISL